MYGVCYIILVDILDAKQHKNANRTTSNWSWSTQSVWVRRHPLCISTTLSYW